MAVHALLCTPSILAVLCRSSESYNYHLVSILYRYSYVKMPIEAENTSGFRRFAANLIQFA